jgi:PKD repeat protein
VPVEYVGTLKEVPPSPDILRAGIEPDEFIADPSKIYISRFSITIGPNVTGESWTTGNAVYMRNPSYTYHVGVSVDGSDVPNLGDGVNIQKGCYLHSQTRDMQGTPSWDLESHEIAIRAGEKKAVNLSLRNFGGGIRQIEFRVPARLKEPGYTFPLETEPGQLLPIPEGIGFTFARPVMTGRNFQQDTNQLIISTTAGTHPGSYRFPLELCYRDMDPGNRNSTYYPFGEKLLCPSCGDFTLTVISGDPVSPAPASVSASPDPTYTSVTPGVVPVSTIARTPAVTTAKLTATPAPSGPFDLKADFSPTSAEGVTPYTVRFLDTSTGSPTSWYWDFDDGNFSTEWSPAHTFVRVTEPDTLKHVTLTVRKGSAVSTRTRDILVHPPYSVPDFTASVTDGPAPLLVVFRDTSTGAPAVGDWKFGDGTFTYETNPQHLYTVKGTYIATLTRTTPWETRSKNMTITVQ